MPKPTAFLRVLAALGLAACSALGLAQQSFRHPAGFEIDLPAGWSAQAHENGQYQLLPGDASATEAVLLLSMPSEQVQNANDPGLIARSEADVRQLFPAMRRQGPPQVFATGLGEALLLGFGGEVEGERVQMAFYLVVHQGTAISLMAVGTRNDVGPRLADLGEMFASVRAAGSDDGLGSAGTGLGTVQPHSPQLRQDDQAQSAAGSALDDGSAEAQAWSRHLMGQRLVVMSGYSSGGSGGMTSRYDLELYVDGSFHLHGGSSVSISVDGLGGSSASQEDERGRWRVIAHSGRPMLELNLTSGERQFGELSRSGEQTFLNGTRVYVTGL